VSDSISLVPQGQPVKLQAELCNGELNDVNNLISGAQVQVPSEYTAVAAEAVALERR
jgi:hypothetical protein